MKPSKNDPRKRALGLRKESLRQIDSQALAEVAGGGVRPDWWMPCMGTCTSYFCV